MSKEPKIVQPIVTRRPAPFRGALRSKDFNDFQEEVVHDIHSISSGVNTNYSTLIRTAAILSREVAYLKRNIDALQRQRDYLDTIAGNFGYLSQRFLDVSDTTGISFPNDLNDETSAMVSSEFGEATVPPTAIESKFFTTSIRSGRIIQPADLLVSVTSVFDKGEGEGLVDYERGGRVSEGRPEWAFNGSNQQYWARRVEFPLDSKVDQVEVELIANVPEGSSSQANLLDLLPFPNGSVDLVSLSTASSLSDTFTTVPNFAATDNITARRYHFSIIKVERVKIRLRQRNWIEENGKKVFYYGLQELGLKLIDYDKTFKSGAAFGKNHTFIMRFDAPTGYKFNELHRVDPSPNFLLEDAGKRHVHLKLGIDSSYDNVKWDSDSNLPPQDVATASTINSTVMYLIFELNFVESTGGSLSPFPVGTTPFINGLGLAYTLEAV